MASLFGQATVNASLTAGSVSPGPLASNFTLTSPTTATAPFTVGYAFKQADVPAGQSVAVSNATAQVVPQNYWPDGSLKFAIISGTAALVASTAKTVSLAVGTASGGTALTTTNLKATGITASIACTSFGTVSWSTTDWDSPFYQQISGAQMSSWIYRKPVGSDAHLVGWLEVRLYASGAVEVLPWIENGYIMVAGETDKSDTYSFTLGGTVRFSQAIDLPSRCRTPLLSGTVTSYWLGTDPQVAAMHNLAYLQATQLVPSYAAVTTPGTDPVDYQVTSYTPLQQGNWSYAGDYMPTQGYQPPIGLLPEHDVCYLTCSSSSIPYVSIQLNGYSAGRYPVHLRDESTNLPIKFSDWPTLSDNSSTDGTMPVVATGTTPPIWDIPHHPSVGFLAYLVTGRYFFLEQLQFAAAYNYIHTNSAYRNSSDGFFSSYHADTTRGAAWSIRTLAQAAVATPEAHPLYSSFLGSMAKNVETVYATYIAQPNNPFGWVAPYSGAYGANVEAPWQQDFYTAVFGYTTAMQPSIGSTDLTQLEAFFQWKAKSIVGRLGGLTAADFEFRDAALFNLQIAPTSGADFLGGTGPWYASWGALYDDNTSAISPGGNTTGANDGLFGDLRGFSAAEPNGAAGYWGNLMPAIAYAVQLSVVGAQAAYQRMTGTPAYAVISGGSAGFAPYPVWSVVPAGSAAALPSWRTALAQWQWHELTGSSMNGVNPTIAPAGATGPSARIDSWTSLVADPATNILYAPGNGGHGDYAGNEVVAINLAASSPAWSIILQPTPAASVQSNQDFYLDGRPSSSHTYYLNHFVPSLGRILRTNSGGTYGTGGLGGGSTYAFSLKANDWDGAGTYPNTSWPANNSYGYGGQAIDESTDTIYFTKNSTGQWGRLDPNAKSVTDLAVISGDGADVSYYNPMVFDHNRRRALLLGNAYVATNGGVMWTDTGGTGTVSLITFTGVGQNTASGYAAHYNTALDKIVLVTGSAGAVELIDPVTFAVSSQTTIGGSSIPTATNEPFGRFVYMPLLGGYAYYPAYTGNVWFLASK